MIASRRARNRPPGRAAVGIEGRVSGHSLRVGGAQSLAAGGASLVEMQTAGRWQSPAMPGHYHGASWQHGAPSLASATVADKASRERGCRRYAYLLGEHPQVLTHRRTPEKETDS